MGLVETYKVVPVGNDIDINGAAANDCDSINMKNFHRATFLVNYQTIGGAANYVKVYSGATDGTKTTALTFRYAFGAAAQGSANCDVLAAWATSANLSVAHATYDNFLLVVEVDASSMTNGHSWLTMSIEDTDTGATGNACVVAVLEPRYTKGQSLTALA